MADDSELIKTITSDIFSRPDNNGTVKSSNKHQVSTSTDSLEVYIDSGTGSSPHKNGSSPQLNSSTPQVSDPILNCVNTAEPVSAHVINSSPVGNADPVSAHVINSSPVGASYNVHSDTANLKDSNTNSGLKPFGALCTFDPLLLEEHSQCIAKIWPNLSPQAAHEFPQFARCYNAIKSKNCLNFLGAKITIKSALNLSRWEEELHSYHDREICQVQDNHFSGRQHLPHVRKFISSELQHEAIIGPFSSPPFQPWTRVSPILTRPKKDSKDRRIIIDLSFPKGNSVNNSIDINSIFSQRTSNALVYIMAKAGSQLLAYLDDYAASAPSKSKALEDYNNFMKMADDLGLSLAKDKCQSPSTSIEWLGFEVDSIKMTVGIPQNKLREISAECE